MLSSSIIILALSAFAAIADVQAHEHGSIGAIHRGAHRRHHAKLQQQQQRKQVAASQPKSARKRRTCPAKTSSAAAASSAVPTAATLIVDTTEALSTPVATSELPHTSSVEFSSSIIPSASSTDAEVYPSATSDEPIPSAVPTTSHAAASSQVLSTVSSASNPVATNGAATSTSALRKIFPVDASARWSTSNIAPNALALSDATLRPSNVLSKTKYEYVNLDGKTVMQAFYAAGSYNFQQAPYGGFSWYGPGPASVDLTKAKEATFSYSVMFEKGFNFVKGGKLPGLYGGDDAEGSKSCSGGRKDAKCWSCRFMWRTGGAFELYAYLPPTYDANNALCNVPPFSECNPSYGASVGRGSATFIPGEWATIAERVRLNDVGKENGEIEVFFNGKSLFTVSGLVLRDSAEGRIRGIQAQTFFGGSTNEWASPTDQKSYFADYSAAITEYL